MLPVLAGCGARLGGVAARVSGGIGKGRVGTGPGAKVAANSGAADNRAVNKRAANKGAVKKRAANKGAVN